MDMKTLKIGDYTVTVSAVKNGEDATASFLRMIAVALYEAADFHEIYKRPLTAWDYKHCAMDIGKTV